MSSEKRQHILIYAPVPPPYAGPEVATSMLLQALPNQQICIHHVASNIRQSNTKKGRMDIYGVMVFLKTYIHFISQLLTTRSTKVYLLLSSIRLAFLRDTLLIITANLLRRKIIVHYRGGNFDNYYLNQCPFFQKLIIVILKRVDFIIVQAHCLKSMFTKILPNQRIGVLYNGLDLTSVEYQSCKPDSSSKQELTLFFMGHLAYSKGFYDLARVMERLAVKYPIRLKVAGSELYQLQHRRTVRAWLSGDALEYFDSHAKNIEDFLTSFISNSNNYNTEYLGILSGEDKRAAFCSADVFVLPSYTEGFSMAVLEAMAHGLAIITTTVGALPEVINEGVNGMLVKAGDQQALELAILQCYTNHERIRLMGETNISYVKDSFNIDKIASQFEAILASV